MSGIQGAHEFLRGQTDALEPFGFIAVVPDGKPFHMVEIGREEDASLEVRVPGRPAQAPGLSEAVLDALRERGFSSEDEADQTKPWRHAVADGDAAVDLALGLLSEVLGEKPDFALDIMHGSRKVEHETRVKLANVRKRLDDMLQGMDLPIARDQDDDYVLPIGDVHVVVAPRALPGGPIVIRVFAVTNVGMPTTPDLGMFIARLNFGLMFGRFALDAEHNAIWFDETLLGDHLHEEELQFTIRIVATTADEWDDRLKQMFGGATHQEMLKERGAQQSPTIKPGAGLGDLGRDPGFYL